MKPVWLKQVVQTPAFIIDGDAIVNRARRLAEISAVTGCKVLYSLKALPQAQVMHWIKPHVHGFSVSSLYEARLAWEVLNGTGEVHLTSPGLIAEQGPELARYCTHISANSGYQYRWLSNLKSCALAIRLNPELSIVNDDRYDPCRPASKLGCSIGNLPVETIAGLHIHNAHDLNDFRQLTAAVTKARAMLGNRWQHLKWLNLGGGYLWTDPKTETSEGLRLLSQLAKELPAIYIEPGFDLVADAGYLASSVVDCWQREKKTLAVLDTSVNHLPEVFEYQRSPELLHPESGGQYPVVFTGGTCLAGDLFGEYRLANQPIPGDRVIFSRVGAYSLIKAHRFNGHPLPSVYSWHEQRLDLIQQDSYDNYRRQWQDDLQA